MSIDLQQILVALVMLVPGFIVSNIQRTFISKRFETDFQWVVSSLLIAIMLNAAAMAVFITIKTEISDLTLKALSEEIIKVKLFTVLIYFAALYFTSVVVGLILGIFPNLQVRTLLNKLKLTSLGSDPSVWNRIFRMQRTKERPITWLKIKLDEHRTILGHLKHSSERVDMDAAFEVYLNEIYDVKTDGSLTPAKMDGLYLRLNPDQPAEIYFKTRDWKPE